MNLIANALRRKFRGRLLWIKNPLARIYQRVSGGGIQYLDWRPLIRRDRRLWQSALDGSKDGPPVLIGTTLGNSRNWSQVESALAVALTLRGARVQVLLCDHHLPACIRHTYARYPEAPKLNRRGAVRSVCQACYPPVRRTFSALGLPLHRMSQWTTPQDLTDAVQIAGSVAPDQVQDYRLDDMAVGEHAVAGAIRYFGSSNLQDEPTAPAVLRRYLTASIITMRAIGRICDSVPLQVACGSHGIYVPQGMVNEVMRRRNIRVVNWHPAYREGCLVFSEGDTYHRTLLTEPVHKWENMAWDRELESKIMAYLDGRQFSVGDLITLNPDPERESLKQIAQMGVDWDRPCIGLLTNVTWDACLHYGASPFRDTVEWLLQTVDYFSRRPDLQLLIRVHPGEIRGWVPSRQPAERDIRQAFSSLPSNVFIIPAESTINTYEAMEACNAVIIYATKAGIEMAARGIPVITAGEAWIKNKQFAFDANSRQEYFSLLDQLPFMSRMDKEATRRARMYAHHFFFRRMIPMEVFNGEFQLNVRGLRDFLPGRNPGLDIVCRGILNGSDFIYPAEQLGQLPGDSLPARETPSFA